MSDDRREGAALERFGLPPAESELDAIRALLAAETQLEADQDDASDTLLIKELCVLLFAAGHVEDALLIWAAKQASFDAACSIEVQLLCGAGVEPTCRYLRAVDSDDARNALDYIRECDAAGDFAALDQQLAAYRRYYRLDVG